MMYNSFDKHAYATFVRMTVSGILIAVRGVSGNTSQRISSLRKENRTCIEKITRGFVHVYVVNPCCVFVGCVAYEQHLTKPFYPSLGSQSLSSFVTA